VNAKGSTVTLHSQVPAGLFKALPDLLMRVYTLDDLPPPPKAVEKKEEVRKPGGQARRWLTTPPAAIPCLHEPRHAA
jgi:hypothetical protein